ncbi:MAG: hypothetical protein ABSA03_19790, partial [Streptosporangiaceae bacterium]
MVPTAPANLAFILVLAVVLPAGTAPARGTQRPARAAFPGIRVTDGGVARAGVLATARRRGAAVAQVLVPAEFLIGVEPALRPGCTFRRPGSRLPGTWLPHARLPHAGLPCSRLPAARLPGRRDTLPRLPGGQPCPRLRRPRPGIVLRRARQAQILLVLRPPAAHELQPPLTLAR